MKDEGVITRTAMSGAFVWQDYRIKGFRHQNLGLTRRRRSRRFQPAFTISAGHGLRRDRSSILKVNID